MEEFVSNSNKSKEEAKKPEKKVEKVITGTAKLKKKSGLQKFAETFISEDMEHVKSYILLDVLIPACKKAVSDIVTNGIDMILYGEAGRTRSSSPASKVSYASFYGQGNRKETYTPRSGTAAGYGHADIVIDNRGEAEEVLTKMDELISAYGIASVADLYEFAGITSDYTDNKYGWTDIRSANIVRGRDGWVIKMPKAMPLN